MLCKQAFYQHFGKTCLSIVDAFPLQTTNMKLIIELQKFGKSVYIYYTDLLHNIYSNFFSGLIPSLIPLLILTPTSDESQLS